MTDPVETSELLAFARTVEAGSVSRAAAELGVPRATVSRRLGRLEAQLGVRLLRRTTRSLVLTDAGEAFYRHARLVLDAVAQAEASVRRSDATVRGDLRVSVIPTSSPSLLQMLDAFATKHPAVRLSVHFSAQHVDLQREGYDVALRASLELEPGLVARTVARVPLLAVASPGYLATRGTPRQVTDLRSHRCLVGFARGQLPDTHWPLLDGSKVRVEGAFSSNSLGMLGAAARSGQGIAMLPLIAVDAMLQSGELIQVLPAVLGAKTRLSVVYVEREFISPAVRAFVDAVVAWAPRGLAEVSAHDRSRSRATRATRPRAPR